MPVHLLKVGAGTVWPRTGTGVLWRCPELDARLSGHRWPRSVCTWRLDGVWRHQVVGSEAPGRLEMLVEGRPGGQSSRDCLGSVVFVAGHGIVAWIGVGVDLRLHGHDRVVHACLLRRQSRHTRLVSRGAARREWSGLSGGGTIGMATGPRRAAPNDIAYLRRADGLAGDGGTGRHRSRSPTSGSNPDAVPPSP